MAADLARNVHLENRTTRTLTYEGVNTEAAAPRRPIFSNGSYEDARYGGVAYNIMVEHGNKALAKWIIAWKVTDLKVRTKILGPDEAVNWDDINREVDIETPEGATDYGFLSEIKIARTGCCVDITASLSYAPSA